MDAVLVINADLGPLHRVTVQHAIRDPRGRAGPGARSLPTWRNTTAACYACNQRKGDRTPAEAGMPLRREPAVPSWASLAGR
ncbi:hypothetical protein E1193_21880 [Micromonospora sp. KC606]|uniref:hypothetical protein n=1 Tax=Micromonospora sp. KC606 TaxID=2530379 RepID=UPI001044B96E|nr:hypothetical protein [Micromonospora sp. KC606]TDC77753.1 hypothetical protein E1193_21880 [Micromonospora sp. KC606]